MKLRTTLSALIILAILTPIPAAAAQSRNLDRRQDITARLEAMRERLTQRLSDRQKLTRDQSAKRAIERRAELRDRQAKRLDQQRFGRRLHKMAAETRLKLRQTLRRVIRKTLKSDW